MDTKRQLEPVGCEQLEVWLRAARSVGMELQGSSMNLEVNRRRPLPLPSLSFEELSLFRSEQTYDPRRKTEV
eukprot:scaffold111700_cov35-Tisochrysis_lutea.AAC.1